MNKRLRRFLQEIRNEIRTVQHPRIAPVRFVPLGRYRIVDSPEYPGWKVVFDKEKE